MAKTKKKHLALYGETKLLRSYCNRCRQFAFIIDDKFQCCDRLIDEKEKGFLKWKQMCSSIRGRKIPPKHIQDKILETQNNLCLYCNKPFNIPYIHKQKLHFSKVNWDHFIPYSYAEIQSDNWVAACNICNSIKSNKIFLTVEEAYYYVNYNRKKKGYYYAEEDEDLPPVSEALSIPKQ